MEWIILWSITALAAAFIVFWYGRPEPQPSVAEPSQYTYTILTDSGSVFLETNDAGEADKARKWVNGEIQINL